MKKNNNKTEKIRKNQRKRYEIYSREAAKRVQENQLMATLETWSIQSGLKYETLKDLVGLFD